MFNHVGREFPAFKAAVAGGPATPAARWFKRTQDGSDYAVFEGHGQLVELDHDEPAVLSYVIEVMTHWLGRGAGGWRLDAAYAVPPSFWAKAVPAVREAFPDAWFLGEMIHGDYAAYAAEAGPRLDHPVRGVEGDLVLAQRPQLLRARPRARHGTTRSWTGSWRRRSSATTT